MRASSGKHDGHYHGSRSTRACIGRSPAPRVEFLLSFADPSDHLVVYLGLPLVPLACRSVAIIYNIRVYVRILGVVRRYGAMPVVQRLY